MSTGFTWENGSWHANFGPIFLNLLPRGSECRMPAPKTLARTSADFTCCAFWRIGYYKKLPVLWNHHSQTRLLSWVHCHGFLDPSCLLLAFHLGIGPRMGQNGCTNNALVIQVFSATNTATKLMLILCQVQCYFRVKTNLYVVSMCGTNALP